MTHDLAAWRTSSFSDRGNCVGLRRQSDDTIAVCNTNDPDRGILSLNRREMAAWIAVCQTGELDDLA